MAKQCCNCNKKIGFLDPEYEISMHKGYYLCERCHIEEMNLQGTTCEQDLKDRVSYFSHILNSDTIPSDIKNKFQLLIHQATQRIAEKQAIAKEQERKQQQEWEIVKKEGYRFTTEMRTITEAYTSDVTVSSGKVVVKRSGRTSLPAESTIYFKDATAVSWGNAAGRSWISFTVPGATSLGRSAVITSSTIAFAISGPNIPYEDSFSIIFGINQAEKAKQHFEIIKRMFDEYKEVCNVTPAPTVMNHTESVMDKLKKLKELKDLGILTDCEYETKRNKLISEI